MTTPKPTILFVDDEVRVLRGLRNTLFEMEDDWNLHFFESASDALKMIEFHPVDVLVTDILMPGMNGFDFARIVKEKFPTIFCIALTGETTRSGINIINDLFDLFLSKPCSKDLVMEALEAGIARKTQGHS